MSAPVCRCKHCDREFLFNEGFTPAIDVCYFCGPLDGRRRAEAEAAALRGEREAGEPGSAPSRPGAGEPPTSEMPSSSASPSLVSAAELLEVGR